MRTLLFGLVVLAVGAEPRAAAQESAVALQPGPWRASLASPGGELPFGLSFARRADGRLLATIHNGTERIAVGSVALDPEDSTVELALDPYDSRIHATVRDGGTRLVGDWRKRRDADAWTAMRFEAVAGAGPRFPPRTPRPAGAAERGAIDGRWAVDFAQDDHPAVAVFESHADGTVHGTFLTTLGDYRYLEGTFEQGVLLLSCFDGAHAFLFRARLDAADGDSGGGVLHGDFWSSDTWHETWTARRDPDAAMPDAFGLTQWTGQVSFVHLSYPDLDGKPQWLDGRGLRGHPRVLVVFGSWCPNCKDATRYLAELDRRHKDRGLRVLGLAFERTGDFERDAAQVRRYAEHQGIDYPVLVCGVADKRKASQALPILDRVRAYPTTIFMRRDGTVHSVHTGFCGPATGAEHEALCARFEAIVDELVQDQR